MGTLAGVLLCSSVHQVFDGPALYCSAADAGVLGERLWWWLHLLCWLSHSCFHGCPAFLHRHFPPPSPPSHHLSVSLKSAAALALGLFQYPLTPAPSCCTFQAACVPVWGTYGCGKDCLILILLRLPQISCFMLSLKCFSSDSDSCPNVIGPLLQFPHPLRAGPIY